MLQKSYSAPETEVIKVRCEQNILSPVFNPDLNENPNDTGYVDF